MTDSAIPVVTPDQMSRVDRIMVDDLGVEVLQLMELAGQAVAAWTRDRFLDGDVRGKNVLVLAGSGGNGGDGMVAARLLHAWGASPAIWLSHDPNTLRVDGATAHQLQSLIALALPVYPPHGSDRDYALDLPDADVIIDALLGFGLSGPPDGEAARLIRAANAHRAPILAVDLPSGLNAWTGIPYEPCIQADATLTLALPKTGLQEATARSVVGELAVADIGVPPLAYARLGLSVDPIFNERSIVLIGEQTGME